MLTYHSRFDNAGNRTAVQEANGDRVTWSYDEAYQLTREQRSGANAYDVTYSYDSVGNRLAQVEGSARTTYSYDIANELMTAVTGAYRNTYSYSLVSQYLTDNSLLLTGVMAQAARLGVGDAWERSL